MIDGYSGVGKRWAIWCQGVYFRLFGYDVLMETWLCERCSKSNAEKWILIAFNTPFRKENQDLCLLSACKDLKAGEKSLCKRYG